MKDQIKIAVITILIFVSGILTGIWTQHHKAPHPPFGHLPEFGGGPMGEFRECAPPDAGPERKEFLPPGDMQNMREKMEKIKPQMEEFKKKFEAIKEKGKAKIIEILNAEQKAKFAEIQTHRDQMISRFKEDQSRMGFGKGGMSPNVEHFEFLSTIIYKPLLERMSQDLKLDDKQKKSVDEILLERRKEVLDLLDSTPPPSIEAWDKKPGERHGNMERPDRRPQQGMGDKFSPDARPEFCGPQGPDDRRAPDDRQGPDHGIQPPPKK